jgi:PAS domain S-box-containing protein
VLGSQGAMRLRTRLMFLSGAVVLLAALVFGTVSYRRERALMLQGIDQELLVAAHLAALVPPEGYFDRLEDEGSVSPSEYDAIVARNNALSERLELQYLWSCMQIDGRIVFTTATSPSHDVTQGDHAAFFAEHNDPGAFSEVFRDDSVAQGRPDYSSFDNEWGGGRMVLLPRVDAQGRKYCLGASLSTAELGDRLNDLLRDTLLLSLGILGVALVVTWLLAHRLTHPLSRLSDVAAAIARGELEAVDEEPASMARGSAVLEIQQLARSISTMGLAIRERLRELRQSESRQRIILDSIGDAVVATDLEGRLVRMNPVAEKLLACPPSRAMGERFTGLVELHHPTTGAAAPDPLGAVLEEGALARSGELLLIAADGSEHRVIYSATPLREAGVTVGAVLALRDITERVLVEEQLRQAHKMEAIGQLAGGIAHDFNNMLAGMTGSAEMLELLVKDSPPALRYIGILRASSERAADLVGKLLNFARRGKMESTPVDVHEVLLTSVALLERSLGKQIELQTVLGAPSAVVVGDPSQIQSAVINLALNARDAMPEGGALVIETRNVELDPRQVQDLGFTVERGHYLHLRVRDTGCGMSPETLQRIFEPFFTTKEVGKGTGLGLPAVYGAVRDHRGALRVESEPGEGTCFHLYLPLSERALPEDEESLGDLERGEGCVLIIDDEELVRAMARGILEHLGYRTLQARDGVEGVQVYQDHRSEIDVVLLDVVMPRMDGRTCLAALRAIDPELRVLVASGFTSEQTVKEFTSSGAAGFIKKPFSRIELHRAIMRALRNGNGNGNGRGEE